MGTLSRGRSALPDQLRKGLVRELSRALHSGSWIAARGRFAGCRCSQGGTGAGLQPVSHPRPGPGSGRVDAGVSGVASQTHGHIASAVREKPRKQLFSPNNVPISQPMAPNGYGETLRGPKSDRLLGAWPRPRRSDPQKKALIPLLDTVPRTTTLTVCTRCPAGKVKLPLLAT